MTESEFTELAAGHALDALSPEDEQAFAAALAAHPEWERHVGASVDAAAFLAETASAVRPPEKMRDVLLARVRETPQERAAAVAPRRGWLVLAASVAVVLVLSLAAVVAGTITSRPVSQTALDQIRQAADVQSTTVALDDGGSVTAYWSVSLAMAALETDGLPQLPSDQTYEMWLVRGDDAIAAGTFTTNADGTATASFDGDLQAGDVMAVTVEAAGGSGSGRPTTDPLIAIPT